MCALGRKKNRGLGGIRRQASTACCLSNLVRHRNALHRSQPSDSLYQPKTTNLNEPQNFECKDKGYFYSVQEFFKFFANLLINFNIKLTFDPALSPFRSNFKPFK